MEFYFWVFVVLNFLEDHVPGLVLSFIIPILFVMLYRIHKLKSENLKLRESIKTLLEAEINFDDCEGEVIVNPPITITNAISEEKLILKAIADSFNMDSEQLNKKLFK